MMFRFSLTHRIWLSFIILVLFIGVIITIIYPISLQQAMKDDSFELIIQEQNRFIQPNGNNIQIPKSDIGFIERQAAARSVGHLTIINQQGELQGDLVPNLVLKKMTANAYNQKKKIGRYSLDYEGAKLFYVIRKVTINSNKGYLISYMWDTYRNQMVHKLWSRLLWILIVAAVASLALAAWLARYLKSPLKALGERFEEISKLNWKEPFVWSSGDEFQKLANQFEDMRQNLIRYDDSQKTFIQQASHELKTPIMVIQSYAQAVKDGLFPQGSLDGSMDIIINETGQMEKRVRKLLYFAKIDSLRDTIPTIESVPFSELAIPVRERFAPYNEHIQIIIDGEDTILEVDVEQFESVIENLVENGLRYAASKILLKAEEESNQIVITVRNDGEAIPDSLIDDLYKPFNKGSKGQFGLGLAIVQSIIERHQGTIQAKNLSDGVAFIIHIPKKR